MSRPVSYQRISSRTGEAGCVWSEAELGVAWPAFLERALRQLEDTLQILHIRDDRGQLTIIRPKTPKSLTHAGARSS